MSKSSVIAILVALSVLFATVIYSFDLYDELYDAFDLDPDAEENFVVFLDVGQADCTLVHSDGEYILIDTGANRDEGNKVKQKLLSYGVRKIKSIILSHDHTDHAGGLYSIISEFSVGSIICPNGALRGDDDFTKDILKIAESKKVPLVSAVVGDNIKLKSGNIEFLWLDERIKENDSCLVLTLTVNGKKFLFGGDISKGVEKRIVEAGKDVKCDVLKASHHGSKNSNSELFLKKANPQYCVVMCAKDNIYDLPSGEFLNRIDDLDIKLYSTAEHSDVYFDLTNNKIKTKK